MTKKIITAVITFAILIIMCNLTIFAEGVQDDIIYNVDFSSGVAVDSVGNMTEFEKPAALIVENAALNSNILEFLKADTCTIKGYNIAQLTSWTLETYIEITGDSDVSILNMTNGTINVSSFVGQTYICFGSTASANAFLIYPETLPRNEWMHLVLVNTGTSQTVYLNGVVIASGNFTTQIQSGVDSNLYLGSWNSMDTGMNMSNIKLYSSAATADEVTAMYEPYRLNPPTPSETPAPTESPVIPTNPELPTGSDYSIDANNITNFSQGETVTVKLAINDISDDGLIGVDTVLVYDSSLLQFDNEGSTSSISTINNQVNGANWFITTSNQSVSDSVSFIDLHLIDDGLVGIKDNNVLWVELSFFAKTDAPIDGGLIAYIEEAFGTLNQDVISVAYGSGTNYFVDPFMVPTAEPTVAPTAEPTMAPTAEPTVAPTAEPTMAPTPEPTAAPTAQPTAPTILVSNVTGDAGDTVDVTISLLNNPGIAVMRLFVDYDSNLKLIARTDGGILGSNVHSPIDDGENVAANPYCLYWNNDTATQNITANGVIVTLTFEILAGYAGNEYPISIHYSTTNYDIYNVDLTQIAFNTISGLVTLTGPAATATPAVTATPEETAEPTATATPTAAPTAGPTVSIIASRAFNLLIGGQTFSNTVGASTVFSNKSGTPVTITHDDTYGDVLNFAADSRMEITGIDYASFTELTISMRIYLPVDEMVHDIIHFGDGNNVNLVDFDGPEGSNKCFYFGAGRNPGDCDVIKTNGNLERGSWNSLIVTCTQTEQVIYFNGIEVKRADYANPLFATGDNTTSIFLGTSTEGRSGEMKIANLQIFGQAATADDVQILQNNGDVTPPTGDASLAIYAILATVSALAVATIVVVKRRKVTE